MTRRSTPYHWTWMSTGWRAAALMAAWPCGMLGSSSPSAVHWPRHGTHTHARAPTLLPMVRCLWLSKWLFSRIASHGFFCVEDLFRNVHWTTGTQTSPWGCAGSHRLLSTSRDNTLRVWNQQLDELVQVPHNNNTGRWISPFRGAHRPGCSALCVRVATAWNEWPLIKI